MKEILSDKIHEECGVFGVYRRGDDLDVVSTAYYALYALQHRGQESCGMAVNDDGVFYKRRELGLVNEVFTKEVLENMPRGNMCIGHCRYATTGTPVRSNAQPFVIRHVKGPMALAHNGNLTNAAELREEFELMGGIFHSTSDTEVIAYTITRERLTAPSIEKAVENAMPKLKGAYSLVVMSPRKLIAARDPHGFRPLCLGKIGDSDVVASESCAILAAGGEFVRDIEPGEIVCIDENGVHSIRAHCQKDTSLCVFEFVYIARPDSVVDGASVHRARRRAGALLALEHPVQADVVIGVPDSGLDAALGYSQQSGIPYGIGFLKNKYIGRTFIQPSQKLRENTVRIKLNPIADTVRGKRVVLVDDSIVRGTTSRQIVQLLREAGATEVHFLSSAPEFLYPCYFGVDVDSRENLIAANHSLEEMREILGVDSLGFLSVDGVKKIAEGCKLGLCTGCFTGQYPEQPPAAPHKSKFEKKISESAD
ncbi:amidophosphoribosyltransferase [uncultured Ruthenibacterium sp.]|uniref:amidophosphoribosyltransferase n=1 Tax=uncultured Ruthenibacterium sp. TaxID=1905347 RepID=UPI00349E5072